MPAGPGHLGQGLRRQRLGLAVRGRREAALEPRVGGTVVALRRDDRAERQGPRDRRRIPRPLRGDRARGLRARAAAQHPVRVPEHRRQEDVHLEGPGSVRDADDRGRAARSSSGCCSSGPAPTTPSSSTRSGPTRSHACSTSSTGSGDAVAGRDVKGDLPLGFANVFRYSLLDPNADVDAEAAALSLPVLAPGDAHPDPGGRRPGDRPRREGRRPRPRPSSAASSAGSPRRGRGSTPSRRTTPSSRSSRHCPRPPPRSTTSIATSSARSSSARTSS